MYFSPLSLYHSDPSVSFTLHEFVCISLFFLFDSSTLQHLKVPVIYSVVYVFILVVFAYLYPNYFMILHCLVRDIHRIDLVFFIGS